MGVGAEVVSKAVVKLIILNILTLNCAMGPLVVAMFVTLLTPITACRLVRGITGVRDGTAVVVSVLCATINIVGFTLGNFGVNSFAVAACRVAIICILVTIFLALGGRGSFSLTTVLSLYIVPFVVTCTFNSLRGVTGFNTTCRFRVDPVSATEKVCCMLVVFGFSSLYSANTCFINIAVNGRGLYPRVDPGGAIRNTVNNVMADLVFALVFAFTFNIARGLVPTLVLAVPLYVVNVFNSLFTSSVGHTMTLGSCNGLVPKRNNVLSHLSDVLVVSPVCLVLVDLKILW